MPPIRKATPTTGKPYRRGDALSQLGKPSISAKKRELNKKIALTEIIKPSKPAAQESDQEEEEEWGRIVDEVDQVEGEEEEVKLVEKPRKKGKKFVESQVSPPRIA